VYNFIHSLLSNFTLTFFAIGLICSAVAIYRHRNVLSKALIVELILKYYCFFAQGVCWSYNGIIHIIFHKMAASFIGWADSPFQVEVGVAIKNNFGLRLGLIISTATFLWGCAAGHIYQMNTTGNHTEGNSGVMLWTGLLMPFISIGLLWLSYTTNRPKFIN